MKYSFLPVPETNFAQSATPRGEPDVVAADGPFQGNEMYPKIACGLLALLTLGVGSGGTAQAQEEEPNVTEQPAVGGNQTVSITLPVQTAGVNANYYRFNVDGNNFTWALTNVTYDPGSTRTGRTNSLGGNALTLSVTTSGSRLPDRTRLPSTSTSRHVSGRSMSSATGPERCAIASRSTPR